MNNKASITALISSFGRAFHAENEEHPVFGDFLAKELMTAEEYAAVQSYLLGGAQFFEPEIDPAKQEPKELLRRLVNVHMMAKAGGEPMQSAFSYAELEKLLEKHGFLIYELLTPDDIQRDIIDKAVADMKAFEHVNYCLAARKA